MDSNSILSIYPAIMPSCLQQLIEKQRMSSEASIDNLLQAKVKRSYHRVTDQQNKKLAFELLENNRSINKAAKIVGINLSTAKVLARKIKKKARISRKPSQRANNNSENTGTPMAEEYANSFAAVEYGNMALFPSVEYQACSFCPTVYVGMAYYY